MNRPPPPPEAERIVKPRRLAEDFPPLIVAHLGRDVVYSERTDSTTTVSEWVLGLQEEPPSLVACQFAGRLLEQAHSYWSQNPRWQFKVAPVEKLVSPEGEVSSIETIVSFFGFAGKVKGLAHRANRYFHLLDPLQFGRTGLDELRSGTEDELVTIYRWADEIRDFCIRFKLKPTTTRGGIAKQLLRDPRFYPEARRKVPRATNDRTREHLPGNHYELQGERDRLYAGLYLDQVSAHHTIAADIPLPHADKLHARGHFHSLGDIPWARPGTKRYERVTGEYGLLYCKVRIRPGGPPRLHPPWAEPPSTLPAPGRDMDARARGEKMVYLWTNELRLLPQFFTEILYVVAAWTSPDADRGIRDYAIWAKEYIRTQPEQTRAWLKPTLLTTYGMLATRPRKPLAGWHRCRNGTETMLPIGRSLLPVQIREAKNEGEPSTNNVLQRGMIEAEMRARSLELATELEAGGHTVLCIYADGVIVKPPPFGQPMPLMPGYWGVKGSLNLLRFMDDTHFSSREMVRLPGVRRDSPLRFHSRRDTCIIAESQQPTEEVET